MQDDINKKAPLLIPQLIANIEQKRDSMPTTKGINRQYDVKNANGLNGVVALLKQMQNLEQTHGTVTPAQLIEHILKTRSNLTSNKQLTNVYDLTLIALKTCALADNTPDQVPAAGNKTADMFVNALLAELINISASPNDVDNPISDQNLPFFQALSVHIKTHPKETLDDSIAKVAKLMEQTNQARIELATQKALHRPKP